MKVIKRDGREIPFDLNKIIAALEAANPEVGLDDQLTEDDITFIAVKIGKNCEALGRAVGVEEIQDMVIDELDKSGHHRLARHYSDYRLRHEMLRRQNSTDKKKGMCTPAWVNVYQLM